MTVVVCLFAKEDEEEGVEGVKRKILNRKWYFVFEPIAKEEEWVNVQ